jgi:MipA family protein
MMTITRILLATYFSIALVGNVLACSSAEDDCVEVGKWDLSLGIGAGVRTSPLEDGDQIPLILVPQVSYTGERFFIQNLDVGMILWENDHHQFNVLATPSYDQVFFHRWSPSNFFLDTNRFATTGEKNDDGENLPIIDTGDKEFISSGFVNAQSRHLRSRRMAGLAGFEYSYTAENVDLQLQYVSDFTDIHNGDEARISLAKHWASGRHHLMASVGAVWQSGEVINYYYGVTAPEADARGTYTSGATISALARFDWNYQLTERWDLRLLASYRHLPDEISASPLINDNKVITLFVGGVYHF